MTDLLISTLTQGLIYALISFGVYITYSILDFPDLGVDGTFPWALRSPPSADKRCGSLADSGGCRGRGRSGRSVHRRGPCMPAGAQSPGRHHHHDRSVLHQPPDRRFQPDGGPGDGHHLHLRAGNGGSGRHDPHGPQTGGLPGSGGSHQAAAGPVFQDKVRPAAAGRGRQRGSCHHPGQGPGRGEGSWAW